MGLTIGSLGIGRALILVTVLAPTAEAGLGRQTTISLDESDTKNKRYKPPIDQEGAPLLTHVI